MATVHGMWGKGEALTDKPAELDVEAMAAGLCGGKKAKGGKVGDGVLCKVS